MKLGYWSFAFGRKDGTYLSESQFFREHSDVELTSYEKRQLLRNLEVQCHSFLQKFYNYNQEDIKPEGYYSTFIYKDPDTNELFLRPLYQVDIRVVFFKKNAAHVLIYDLRKGS